MTEKVMPNEHLIHLIYSSASASEMSNDELMALLDKARQRNEKLGVTGMLLHDEGSFFQVLEGDERVVGDLFKTIAQDNRHDRIVKLISEPIEERSFSEWSMGYSGVSRDDLKAIDGLNDFFHTRNCFTTLTEGRAKTLLDAFKDGKWRASLA